MRVLFFLGAVCSSPLIAMPTTAATLAQSYSQECFGYSDLSESEVNDTVTAGGGGTVNNAFSTCSNSSDAIAGGGYVGVAASSSASTLRILETSVAYSRAAWYDTFSVEAPEDWTGGPIDVQVVFSMDADAFANIPTNSTDNASAVANFELILSAQSSRAGTNPWNSRFADTWNWSEYGGGPDIPSFNRIFTSAILSVQPGQDVIAVGIDFDARTVATAPDGSAEVEFNGLYTASLSATGPAFILPEGFFITNESANVFENFWVDPRAVPVSPVPIPASLPLFFCALLLSGLAVKSNRSS